MAFGDAPLVLGLTRGEGILVLFVFGLIYTAGLLPKIAARLSSKSDDEKKQH